MLASARLDTWANEVRGAINGLKLEGLRIDAACLPGADAKSFNALFRMGKLGAQGRMLEDELSGTRRSICHPGSAQDWDGTDGRGSSGAG